MKICPSCKKTYSDNYDFCITCGSKLQIQKKIDKSKGIAIIMAIVVFIGLAFVVYDQKSINDTRKVIEEYKQDKAIAEYLSTPTKNDIKINDDWDVRRSGGYIYINGTVTNTSYSKTISYFEIEAKFYDGYGNVINSDWTNDASDLNPGETRKFEIMHKHSYDEKEIRLSIRDVS